MPRASRRLNPRDRDDYRLLGPCYDALCRAYGGRLLGRCRGAMIDRIQPGEAVLFAGVGHGSEAVAAAERGARVSAIDTSPTMLRRLRRKVERDLSTGASIELRELDILTCAEFDHFDWVFANFFLNVFDRATMRQMLKHLARLARIGGHVVIGDFCFPEGGRVRRTLQQAHWFLALAPFALCTGNAVHPIYDYSRHFPDACLKTVETRRFAALGVDLYSSTLTKRYAEDPTTVIQSPSPGAAAAPDTQ